MSLQLTARKGRGALHTLMHLLDTMCRLLDLRLLTVFAFTAGVEEAGPDSLKLSGVDLLQTLLDLGVTEGSDKENARNIRPNVHLTKLEFFKTATNMTMICI